MYNLLIVEDEEILRNGLKTTIDWASLGYVVIDVAKDGMEGLDKFNELKPDVVLTDIRMPHMNGLTMSSAIKGINSDTEIVLLSGYDEFSYAKQGIEIGVYNYIMKLNMYEEINNVFGKLKLHLDKSKRNQSDAYELEKIRFENKIDSLIAGRGDGWLKSMDTICVLVGEVNGSIDDSMFSINDDFLCVYRIHKNSFVAIGACKGLSDMIFDSRIMIIARSISSYMVNGNIVISKKVNREGEVLNAVIRAFKMIDIAKKKKGRLPNIMLCEKDMEAHLTTTPTLNYDTISQQLELQKYHYFTTLSTKWYFDAVTGYGIYIYNARNMAKRLILKIMDELDSIDKEYTEELEDVMNDIEEIVSIIEVEKVFMNAIKPALSTLQKVNYHQAGAAIDDAVKFIDRNYDKQISIEEIASMIHLSIPYFSASFKKITGSNYSKYLRSRRMEKACELLTTTNLKIYEISHIVGYLDEKHFSKMFSKYIGETPISYRKSKTLVKDKGK